MSVVRTKEEAHSVGMQRFLQPSTHDVRQSQDRIVAADILDQREEGLLLSVGIPEEAAVDPRRETCPRSQADTARRHEERIRRVSEKNLSTVHCGW